MLVSEYSYSLRTRIDGLAGVKVVCRKKMPEGAELKKMLDCMKRFKTRDSQKYYDLVEKMVRGPFEVLLLEGVNAFQNVNKMIGKPSQVDTVMGTYCWKRDPVESLRFAFVGETVDEVKMDILDWFADIKI